MRMFACLVPPRPVLEDLEATLAGLPAEPPVRPPTGPPAGPGQPADGATSALRWVPAHQQHITLAFHGEVPDDAAELLRADLAGIAASAPPLSLRLAGSGVFSDRVLWAGVETCGASARSGEPDPLVALMTACRDAVSPRRVSDAADDARNTGAAGEMSTPSAPVARGTSTAEDAAPAAPIPHLTLARMDRRGADAAPLHRLAEDLAGYTGPEWSAGRLLLMRSQLGAGPRGSARHTVVAELPLGG